MLPDYVIIPTQKPWLAALLQRPGRPCQARSQRAMDSIVRRHLLWQHSKAEQRAMRRSLPARAYWL